MELKVMKDELLNVVNIASRAVPSKTSLPILECIVISAKDKLTFTATDTEIGVTTIADAEIQEQGEIAIDAKLFGDVVRKLPDGEVRIKVNDDNTARVTCGKAKFTLAVRDAEEFPYIEDVARDNGIALRQYDLKEIIRQTIFSVAVNENNKVMTGEYFEISDKLKVTALDGHRIAIRTLDLDKDYGNIKMIIPSKTLLELSKILSDDGNITIYYTPSNALFEFDNTTFSTRLIEGEYFDVAKMVSDDFSTSIKVSRKELIDALDRTTLLVKEIERKPVLMNIGEELELKITTNLGSMDEMIEVKKEGNGLLAGFNPRFLLDALRAIDDGEVSIYFQNPKAPCYIKDSGTYLYMVLPVSIQQANA